MLGRVALRTQPFEATPLRPPTRFSQISSLSFAAIVRVASAPMAPSPTLIIGHVAALADHGSMTCHVWPELYVLRTPTGGLPMYRIDESAGSIATSVTSPGLRLFQVAPPSP